MKNRVLAMLGCAVFVAPFVVAACGGGNDNLPPPPPPPPPPPTASVSASASASTAVVDAGPVTPPAPPVALVLGTASPDPTGPAPTTKIVAPTNGQIVAADKAANFEVKLDVKNWPTAAGSSHVHLILDNKPYKRIDDPKVPVKLSELVGSEPLAEGEHTLVAFPSRANHESVKNKDALAIVQFYVGKKGEAKVDPKKPLLIFSRPKGDYNGAAANHVLVDFQLANVTLAEGKEHVHIFVSGPGIEKTLEAKAEKFGPPFYLDNLQNGTYTVKLELMDKDMKTLPGPWNSTTRTIKIDHDAPSDPAMDHGAHAPAGSASAAPSAAPSAKPSAAPSASAAPKK
jgi:hypothetical protein